jgi:T-complex protein 1 subunit eta
MLRMAKPFVEDGVHPRIIINGYRRACKVVLEKLKELSVDWENKNEKEVRNMLEKCAMTAMNSKLISGHKEFFGPMVVDAVQCLDERMKLDMIGMVKVPGGSVTECKLIKGVAFPKTFSYAGFEQQPKRFENPKIALLQVELELKSEAANAEVRMTDVAEYQKVVDAEWKIIYDKLDKIVASGAQIVLSELPIGDLATQYFADRDIFCAGRVPKKVCKRIAAATGAIRQTSINDLTEDVLGTCGLFEETQVGSDRFNMFTECKNAKTATMIIRGGAEQFIAETVRSLHDAIMIVKRCIQHKQVVAGGGAVEMELSRYVRQYSRQIRDKSQIIMGAFGKAFEVIPRQLATNAGFDATDIVNELRFKHARGHKNAGVDIEAERTHDTFENFVWEPALSKRSSIAAACEAACTILGVDETIRNPRSQNTTEKEQEAVPNPRARPTGRASIR